MREQTIFAFFGFSNVPLKICLPLLEMALDLRCAPSFFSQLLCLTLNVGRAADKWWPMRRAQISAAVANSARGEETLLAPIQDFGDRRIPKLFPAQCKALRDFADRVDIPAGRHRGSHEMAHSNASYCSACRVIRGSTFLSCVTEAARDVDQSSL